MKFSAALITAAVASLPLFTGATLLESRDGLEARLWSPGAGRAPPSTLDIMKSTQRANSARDLQARKLDASAYPDGNYPKFPSNIRARADLEARRKIVVADSWVGARDELEARLWSPGAGRPPPSLTQISASRPRELEARLWSPGAGKPPPSLSEIAFRPRDLEARLYYPPGGLPTLKGGRRDLEARLYYPPGGLPTLKGGRRDLETRLDLEERSSRLCSSRGCSSL